MTKKTITIILENGKTMEMDTPEAAAKALDAIAKNRAAKRKWYSTHKEQAKKANKRWLDAHPGYAVKRAREWQKANPERVRENSKRWRDANPEKVRENHRISNARRKLRKEAEKLGMVVSLASKA